MDTLYPGPELDSKKLEKLGQAAVYSGRVPHGILIRKSSGTLTKMLHTHPSKAGGIVARQGMVSEPTQPRKAPPKMEDTDAGITVLWHPDINLLLFVWIMALQLSLLSNTGLFGSTVMEVRPPQLVKA